MSKVHDEVLMPSTFEGMQAQAQVLLKSGLMPPELNTVEKIVTVGLAGRDFGWSILQSVRFIHIVKGKPSISAQAMGGLIKQQGHSYHVDELTDKDCVITFQRKGGVPYTHSFTIGDGTRAGLAGQDTWKKYTKAMLFNRCMSAGARIEMPDVIGGMYTPDELSDGAIGTDLDGEIVGPAVGEKPAEQPKAEPAEHKHALPPEPKVTPTRPYAPEVVKSKLLATAAKANDTSIADAARRGAVAGNLETAGGSVQARHLFLDYVFGIKSSKDLTNGQVTAIGKWLSYKDDDGNWQLLPEAVEEMRLIVREQQRALGQQDMFEEAA